MTDGIDGTDEAMDSQADTETKSRPLSASPRGCSSRRVALRNALRLDGFPQHPGLVTGMVTR
jgi:hypothetical protein